MENILDFIKAALPWIAMGLLLAIFFARSAAKKRKNENEETKDDYGAEGMCLGMCLGTAIGSSFGNNTGIGISLGMLIGLAIGTCLKKEAQNKDNEVINGERKHYSESDDKR